MDTEQQQQQQTSNNCDSDKCQKVKRFVIVALLITIGILSWHFYGAYQWLFYPHSHHSVLIPSLSLSLLFTEYFHGQPLPKTPEDVLSLSQALFAEESQPSAYLYKVNLQGKTSSGARDDRAAQPWVASGIVNTLSTTEYVTYVDFHSLFELHNDLLVREANSTTALLQRLFNNYELDVTMPDVVTKEHEQEQIDFLRAVLNTRVMKLTMRFLVKKGKHNWASCFRFYLMYIYNMMVIRTSFNSKFHLSN